MKASISHAVSSPLSERRAKNTHFLFPFSVRSEIVQNVYHVFMFWILYWAAVSSFASYLHFLGSKLLGGPQMCSKKRKEITTCIWTDICLPMVAKGFLWLALLISDPGASLLPPPMPDFQCARFPWSAFFFFFGAEKLVVTCQCEHKGNISSFKNRAFSFGLFGSFSLGLDENHASNSMDSFSFTASRISQFGSPCQSAFSTVCSCIACLFWMLTLS